jgi:hypothetical protein
MRRKTKNKMMMAQPGKPSFPNLFFAGMNSSAVKSISTASEVREPENATHDPKSFVLPYFHSPGSQV